MRAVLRNRGFAALWFAQLVSRIGDSIHEIALIWIVYEVTGDPALIAVVALASFVPTLLLSIPAGVLVDRMNRKYLLVGAEGLRGIVVLAIPLIGRGPYLVPIVIAVALVASTMEAFFGPAQQATIPRLVDRDDLDAANSLNNLTLSTSRLFYVAGGVIVGIGGSFVAFYLNSASFLLAALVLLLVPTAAGRPESDAVDAQPAETETADAQADESAAEDSQTDDAQPAPAPAAAGAAADGPTMFEDAMDGIRFIRGNTALLAVIAMGVFVDFAFVPLVVVLPVFATDVLGGGSGTYGFLLGAYFAGTLAGNLLVGTVRGFVDEHRGPVMVVATVLTGVGVGLAAWLPLVVTLSLAASIGGFILAGVCNPFINVPLTTYAQAVVPDDMRGKVFAVMRLGITGAAPIGIALAGPLVGAFGSVPVLLGMSSIVALAGLSGLFTPLVRIGSVVPDAEPAD